MNIFAIKIYGLEFWPAGRVEISTSNRSQNGFLRELRYINHNPTAVPSRMFRPQMGVINREDKQVRIQFQHRIPVHAAVTFSVQPVTDVVIDLHAVKLPATGILQ